MGDFVEQTAVEEVGEGLYRARLHTDWMTWGPAGGYVAAVALRAAAAASSFGRPASFMWESDREARAPAMREWCRFRPNPHAEDRFVDAVRSVILIGAGGSVWRGDGRLVAVGSSQLFCRPRPQRFR